jgi:hypothetical protein
MDSYGNSGFKGVGSRSSSTVSKNVKTQNLSVTGTTVLTDVTVDGGLQVAGNTRLGNSNTDSVGFYTTNGVAQQTTGVASATVVSGAAGDAITVTTFDGYTVAKVVRSLRNVGLLA